jgi:hypothetical protein
VVSDQSAGSIAGVSERGDRRSARDTASLSIIEMRRVSSATEGLPKMRVSILAVVFAVSVGFALPAFADERPSDPFGSHTIEINNQEAPLVEIWDSLRHQMRLEKAYFYECLRSKDDPCPLIPALAQKLDEIRQYRGNALLGHLNIKRSQ